MNKPLFAFEVPVPHLQDFDEDQEFVFSLSFLYKHSTYFNYFKQTKLMHILDNSYNELGRPEGTTNLIQLQLKVGADLVVSPDSDSWSTEETLNHYNRLVRTFSRLFVLPVARSLEQLNAYVQLGSRYMAIPYEYRNTPELLQHPEVEYHFLGLNNINEVLNYRPSTCDTSMPIKIALQNMTLDEWIERGCPHIHTKDLPDFFNRKLTKKQINLCKHNIYRLKELRNVH